MRAVGAENNGFFLETQLNVDTEIEHVNQVLLPYPPGTCVPNPKRVEFWDSCYGGADSDSDL